MPEPYLYLHIAHRIRSAISKFRTGNHDLEIEKGRHQKLTVNERLCKLCLSVNKTYVEDEYHVLMVCQFYNDLRNIYLDLTLTPINLFTFITLMSSTDENMLTRLGLFLANMFKLRKSLLKTL